MSPARVSNAIDLPAIPRSEAKRAAHRPPFPHISAADPSALKNFHRKSARRDRPRKIIPSAPIDRERSHTLRANAGRSIPFITPFRLSIRRKSFPLPFSLEKGISFFTSAPPRKMFRYGSRLPRSIPTPPMVSADGLPPGAIALRLSPRPGEERRGPFPPGQVPDGFPLPHHLEPRSAHHDFRGAGARVVGRGHREAVGAGAHDRDEVARRKGGKFPVPREEIPRFADGTHHVGHHSLPRTFPDGEDGMVGPVKRWAGECVHRR